MGGQPVIQPKADAVKSARERIIKLLVDVRVDTTHQSTTLDIFQSFAFTDALITTHACMP